MQPWGRRQKVAPVGFLGMMALTLVMTAAGLAATIRADTYHTDIDLTSKEVGSREVSLGDLVADAIRASAKSDAAFIAASSFNETTIPKGAFTAADVFHALTYAGDSIVIVKLTGDQIRRALEHGLYLYPGFNSGFLQFSGMTVTINPDADRESHVLSASVKDESLDATKTYHVAMPAPLANGALAYFKIWKKSDIEKDTNVTLDTAITNYLNEHKNIVKGEDRLVVKGK